jgi:hypothetical protein
MASEYADAPAKASEICVLSSSSDFILEWAFPAGNLVGEIIMHGHPDERTVLGRNSPARPIPSSLHVGAWQIPHIWDYGHLDYLQKDKIESAFPLPVVQPGPGTGVPVGQNVPVGAEWKPAWSAGAVATKAT